MMAADKYISSKSFSYVGTVILEHTKEREVTQEKENTNLCCAATHLRMHRHTLPPDVNRQNPNLCLLSMSVSTKVKCCPT